MIYKLFSNHYYMNDWNRLVKKLIEEERALGNDVNLRVILVKAKKIKNSGGMGKYLSSGKNTGKRVAKKSKKSAKRVSKKSAKRVSKKSAKRVSKKSTKRGRKK
jgi:uncharacterized protein YoxC